MSVKVIFGYDISCPWAYIASMRLPSYAKDHGFWNSVEYQPILLGGIYDAIGAKQGKAGSASDVMSPNKKNYESMDLARTAKRWNVPLSFHPRHPMKTVTALRLLHSLNQQDRIKLTNRLYKAYWVDHLNLDDAKVVCALYEDVFSRHLSTDDLERIVSGQKDTLRKWTDGFISAGVIGVPSFWVGKVEGKDVDFTQGELFWGGDRLHFVASEFNKLTGKNQLVHPPRIFHASKPVRRQVEFYFDFSSPWTYLGWTQHRNAVKETKNVEVDWTYVPTVLGIVFKEIGTPIVPSLAVHPAKRASGSKDMTRWVQYWNDKAKENGTEAVGFQFNQHFPLRTPLALRVALASKQLGLEKEYGVIDAIFKGAWAENKDISKPEVLEQIVEAVVGKDLAKKLLQDAESDQVKAQLRKNTQNAVSIGVVGFPSFRLTDINGLHGIIWGQDKLDVLQDTLSGWTAFASSPTL